MSAIISKLDVESLRSFLFMNREYNHEASRFLYRSYEIHDRSPEEGAVARVKKCCATLQRDPRRAQHIRNLVIDITSTPSDYLAAVFFHISHALYGLPNLRDLCFGIPECDLHILSADYPFRLTSLCIDGPSLSALKAFMVSQPSITSFTWWTRLTPTLPIDYFETAFPNLKHVDVHAACVPLLTPHRPISSIKVSDDHNPIGLTGVLLQSVSQSITPIRELHISCVTGTGDTIQAILGLSSLRFLDVIESAVFFSPTLPSLPELQVFFGTYHGTTTLPNSLEDMETWASQCPALHTVVIWTAHFRLGILWHRIPGSHWVRYFANPLPVMYEYQLGREQYCVWNSFMNSGTLP